MSSDSISSDTVTGGKKTEKGTKRPRESDKDDKAEKSRPKQLSKETEEYLRKRAKQDEERMKMQYVFVNLIMIDLIL